MGAGRGLGVPGWRQRRERSTLPAPGLRGHRRWQPWAVVGSSVPADAVQGGELKERLGVLQSDPCWHSVWWQRKSTGSGGLRPGPAIAIFLEKVLHLLGLVLHTHEMGITARAFFMSLGCNEDEKETSICKHVID